jgi:hypothetical protein
MQLSALEIDRLPDLVRLGGIGDLPALFMIRMRSMLAWPRRLMRLVDAVGS